MFFILALGYLHRLSHKKEFRIQFIIGKLQNKAVVKKGCPVYNFTDYDKMYIY